MATDQTQAVDPLADALASIAPPPAPAQAVAPAPDPAAAPAPAPQAPVPGAPVQGPGIYPDQEPGLTDPTNALDAAVGGAAKAVYETKDFFFGKGEKGATRQAIESGTDKATKNDVFNGFVSGVSQFAVGLLGAGKVVKGLEIAAPVVKGLIEGSKAVKTGVEVAKAASVGAVAFDPSQERMSNLVQSVPWAANPVTDFLEAKPGDSAALGRVKASLESIGMDALAIGLFMGAAKLYKGRVTGHAADIEAGTQEVTTNIEAQQAARDAPAPVEAPPVTRTAANENGGLPGEATPTLTDPMAANTGPEVALKPAANENAIVHGEATQVQNATEAGAPKRIPLQEVDDATLNSLIDAVGKDADAMVTASSWNNAVAQGHTFGGGVNIPWQKIVDAGDKPSTMIQVMTDRVAAALKDGLDAAKGGDIMSDPRINRMVGQRQKLWGEDPAAMLGMLQAAGKDATTMAANMEAGFIIAQRSMQDSFTLAARISAGELTAFGGDKKAAVEALKQMVEIASTAYGSAQSMRASAGRAMRRMRGEFQVDAGTIEKLKGLDGEMLTKMLADTNGNPRGIAAVLKPTLMERALDASQWLLVNNLLWGPTTHFVNLSTNAYMIGIRPMERMIGSFGVRGGEAAAIRAESMRQYAYTTGVIHDSWKSAVEAWKLGDSPLMPHSTEATATSNIGKTVVESTFRNWDSVPNVLYNAVLGMGKTVGAPTRALGTADEFMKQVVYRSKVQAAAHVEGVQNGLTGTALSDHVTGRLYDAFDDAGRAVDANALREAQIATFQQDLLPGTLGSGVQNLAQNFKPARFVLPFIKTPTNVLRMGVKLTPGLNVWQREYQQMIKGAMGPEMQAQAMGQMAMGSLFMGVAAHHAMEGTITGGGPQDPKLKAALQATGWQPYSFVLTDSKGGKTYVPYNRYDPVAMPFGMVADVVDIMSHDTPANENVIMAASTAVLMGLVKNITNKTYLKNLDDTIQALSDKDESAARWVGQMGSNLVPMSSALRFGNPDDTMRDARTFVDRIKRGIPGLSSTLPPRRDAWGDPMTVHKGLWAEGKSSIVDIEMRRLGEDQEVSIGPPQSAVEGGVDLRDITMVDGRNAYDVYQQLAAQPTPRTIRLKDQVAKVIEGSAYQRAPDGDAQTKGTKLAIIATVMKRYHAPALEMMKRDKNVRDAMQEKQRAVAGAYAASKPNPTPANNQKEGLARIGSTFGVDLEGIAAAMKPQ